MPKLDVEGYGEYDVEEGVRLVLALTDVVGVDKHTLAGAGTMYNLPDRVFNRRARKDDSRRTGHLD